MRLSELRLGDAGRVVTVSGDDDVSVRLMEMGLIPETVVRLIGRAPLGDPLELELRGYRLSVRASEAQRVEVVPH